MAKRASLSKAARAASTLGGALGCAAKVRRGEACSPAELRASLVTLSQAYNAIKQGKRMAEDKAKMLSDLLKTAMRT